MKIKYNLLKTEKDTMARLGTIETNYGTYETPMFMPVGTEATVKTLSVEELKIVHMWVDDNYSYEEISEAVFDSLKAKKTQIKYADAILVNRRQNMNREKVDVDPDIKEVLNSINVKRNY